MSQTVDKNKYVVVIHKVDNGHIIELLPQIGGHPVVRRIVGADENLGGAIMTAIVSAKLEG